MGSWAGDMVERTTKAMQTGYLRGANRGLQESLDAWKAHARELENNVEYFRALASAYRGDAISGWAKASAYAEFLRRNGIDPNEPSVKEEVEAIKEEKRQSKKLREMIDEEAKQVVKEKIRQ